MTSGKFEKVDPSFRRDTFYQKAVFTDVTKSLTPLAEFIDVLWRIQIQFFLANKNILIL